jgi:ribosome-binding protein aMBF1 (putative translation factor)
MIRNEAEYREAVGRIQKESERLDTHHRTLQAEGLTVEEIKRVMEPLVSFHLQLKEEVEAYERLKRGDLGELRNLHGFGRLLIGLRIARGLSQRDLAERLDVHESQVSRDERNDYHGITIERASRILDALGVSVKSTVEGPLVQYEEQLTGV